ncbi:phage portal protein [Phascolarctobacterium succinatutens]|uniref:phage portal protein n=1 Tax=Phascolarctobacterium succinatutens TaxID=626940 RepID=UPI0039913ADB
MTKKKPDFLRDLDTAIMDELTGGGIKENAAGLVGTLTQIKEIKQLCGLPFCGYMAKLETVRPSGVPDEVTVVFAEDVPYRACNGIEFDVMQEFVEGSRLLLTGKAQTLKDFQSGRLLVYILADFVAVSEKAVEQDEVAVRGVIANKPTHRETPRGKHITDITVMYELRLLAGNGYTQELTAYEKTRLVERTKAALIRAKEEDGLEIQGKMRDLVAAMINESSTNVARMDAINNNATPEIKEQLKEGNLGITAAYEAAKLDEDEQKEIEDEYGRLCGWYPLRAQRCEVVEAAGQVYLRYLFANGEHGAIEFERVGIMTDFEYTDDLFGEDNRTLKPTMQLIHTQNEGIINAVKNSANIRFLAKVANILKPEDIKKERQRFTEDNLSADNDSGMIIYDNKFSELKQVESKPYTPNALQMQNIQENVCTHFGTNMDILQNKFDENTWNAYYEGKIEPFAIQLSLVMTNMSFTERERACGNAIFFSANRLQYASNATKLTPL